VKDAALRLLQEDARFCAAADLQDINDYLSEHHPHHRTKTRQSTAASNLPEGSAFEHPRFEQNGAVGSIDVHLDWFARFLNLASITSSYCREA
jgi:hypothetical protein